MALVEGAPGGTQVLGDTPAGAGRCSGPGGRDPGSASAGRHLGTSLARPTPIREVPRRDLRPRAAPYLPVPQRTDLPEAWAYLSPACRQYATMMSREGARRAESRRPVNVGSGRDPESLHFLIRED